MNSDTPDPREPHLVLDLALRAGEVLLSGGAGASSVTATCTQIAEAGGLHRVECDITYTSLSLSGHPSPDDVAPVTSMRLVHQREIDYTRVTAVHNVVSGFLAGRFGRAEATRRLDAVATSRHPYPRAVVTAARATLAASVAVLLGAGPVVTGAAFAATVLIDLANGVLGRAGVPTFYQNALGGAIATATAVALVTAGTGIHPALVVAGGIVLLLPGVTLVGAVQDAITGFYVTASARTFETFLLTAGIISGVAATLSVAVRLGLPVRIGDPPLPGLDRIPWQLLAAAVVSASFAVANFAPRRTVPTAGLAGAVGWAVFVTVDWLRLPPALASATAAVVIGVGALLFAHRQQVPTLVYVAGGIIPLLPGLAIYRGLRHLAEGDMLAGVSLLGQAVSTGLALAAGAILGEFLAQAVGRTDARLLRRLAGLRPAGPPRWRRRPPDRTAGGRSRSSAP
ncbi:threonine/serine exporter family protein [Blastococcus jejuensis]|uniref:Threonine/serine exporter family protein n=1 Tax=Blastococcus jejuensis TaxID=351224 RepID=A0ABP6NPR4_9ACTN